jgi:hypothetical protein
MSERKRLNDDDELLAMKRHREKRLKEEAEERERVEAEKRKNTTEVREKEGKMLIKAEIATTEIEKWEKRLRGQISRENDHRKHRGTGKFKKIKKFQFC